MVHHPWGRFSTESGGIAEAFRWIAFNQSYNGFFKPYTFDVPKGGRVRLVAVITGHGNDNHGCGEFCATEHSFAINGRPPHVKRQLLPATATEVGCAEEVDTGVIPNEYGTWLYGRDGWCNGREVVPWVVDVSDDITGEEGTATLTYSAAWCPNASYCEPPNPGPPATWQQAAPVMMVSVYLVVDALPPSSLVVSAAEASAAAQTLSSGPEPTQATTSSWKWVLDLGVAILNVWFYIVLLLGVIAAYKFCHGYSGMRKVEPGGEASGAREGGAILTQALLLEPVVADADAGAPTAEYGLYVKLAKDADDTEARDADGIEGTKLP